MDLSVPAQRLLAKGLGAYVRAASPSDLPPKLHPVKRAGGTAKGIERSTGVLVAALEEEALRGQVAQWLREAKPKLGAKERDALQLACERPEGWAARLEGLVAPAAKAPRQTAGGISPERLEREKEATRRAKEEARRARVEAQRLVEDARKEAAQRAAELEDLAAELRAARAAQGRAENEVKAAADKLDREARKMRKQLETVSSERDDLRKRVKGLQAEVRELTRSLDAARKVAAAPRARETRPAPAKKTGPRKALKPPKGRLASEPESLEHWLRRDDVTVLVDGYNVTMHEKGFKSQTIDYQRETLQEMLKTFVVRYGAEVILVWDSTQVPAGDKRRRWGKLRIQFTAPGEQRHKADEHILELLDELPPGPVVVVTNDGDLQSAAARRGATIATSEQLLTLLRKRD